MTPHTFPDLFSKLIVNGVLSPGTCTITGADREQKWSITEPSETEGASTKYGGEPVAQFQASFFLADDEDFAAWPAFQRLIESSVRGPTPVALAVFHPTLAAQRIGEVVAANIGGLVYDSRGGAIALIKFLEYRPPRPKSPTTAQAKGGASASGASTAADATEPYDPNKAAKEELAGLLEDAAQP